MCSFSDKLRKAKAEKRRTKRVFFCVEERKDEMMNTIKVIREIYTDLTTTGILYLPNGERFCHTLEDTVRRHKIQAKTAIPAGRYEIRLEKSPKFNRLMPYLLDVPYYSNIMIHWGNYAKDTMGCLLVGFGPIQKDFVGNSKRAFDELYDKIHEYLTDGKLFIDIVGGFKADEWAESKGEQNGKKAA